MYPQEGFEALVWLRYYRTERDRGERQSERGERRRTPRALNIAERYFRGDSPLGSPD